MNVSILVYEKDKFVVHYKTADGFTITGFRSIESAKEFSDKIRGLQPRINTLGKYVTLENIIFDYFNEMRGKYDNKN